MIFRLLFDLMRSGLLLAFLGVFCFHAEPAADQQSDNTAQIQKRLDQAAPAGGVVVLETKKYLISGHLKITIGVALQGGWTSPRRGDAWQKRITLLITGWRYLSDYLMYADKNHLC